MLLKEDGHLDIERVEQLSDEELEKEMEDWDEDQWFDWTHKDGSMTHKEVFGYLRQKVREAYAQKQTNTEDDGED